LPAPPIPQPLFFRLLWSSLVRIHRTVSFRACAESRVRGASVFPVSFFCRLSFTSSSFFFRWTFFLSMGHPLGGNFVVLQLGSQSFSLVLILVVYFCFLDTDLTLFPAFFFFWSFSYLRLPGREIGKSCFFPTVTRRDTRRKRPTMNTPLSANPPRFFYLLFSPPSCAADLGTSFLLSERISFPVA